MVLKVAGTPPAAVVSFSAIFCCCCCLAFSGAMETTNHHQESVTGHLPGSTALAKICLLGSHDAGILTSDKHPEEYITQTFTIAEQWNRGWRVFDVRAAKNKRGELHLAHPSWIQAVVDHGFGPSFAATMQQLNEAMDAKPREFAILRLKTPGKVNSWGMMFAQLRGAFGDKLTAIPDGQSLGNMHLEQLEGKVLLLFHGLEPELSAQLVKLDPTLAQFINNGAWSTLDNQGKYSGKRSFNEVVPAQKKKYEEYWGHDHVHRLPMFSFWLTVTYNPGKLYSQAASTFKVKAETVASASRSQDLISDYLNEMKHGWTAAEDTDDVMKAMRAHPQIIWFDFAGDYEGVWVGYPDFAQFLNDANVKAATTSAHPKALGTSLLRRGAQKTLVD